MITGNWQLITSHWQLHFTLICCYGGAYDEAPMKKISIVINGESRTVPAVRNIPELLKSLGIATDGIAVELNKNIIRRRDWEDTTVEDGDRLEIVQFVGGG